MLGAAVVAGLQMLTEVSEQFILIENGGYLVTRASNLSFYEHSWKTVLRKANLHDKVLLM